MTRIFRFFLLLVHLLRAIWIFGLSSDNQQVLRQGIAEEKQKKIQQWLTKLLSLLRVRVHIHGNSFSYPKVIIANHISWLDVILLCRYYQGHFIAKKEIQSWPLLGAMISAIGTLFIERSKKRDTKLIAGQIQQIIQNRHNIIFFPEARTGDGKKINKIYPALFQYAIDAAMDIQPVLLVYHDSSGIPSDAVPYRKDQNLLTSVWQVLGQKEIHAHIYLLQSISTKNKERKSLAAKIELQLQQQLQKAIDEHKQPG